MRQIYFIYDGGEYVKIGVSENPERRLKDLQTSSPRKLYLLCAFGEAESDDEAWAHECFERDRALGEWFRLSNDLRGFLKFVHETQPTGSIGSAYFDYVDDEALRHKYGAFFYQETSWADAVQKGGAAV